MFNRSSQIQKYNQRMRRKRNNVGTFDGLEQRAMMAPLISIAPAEVIEGQAAELVVTLSEAHKKTVKVKYQTETGTAGSADYTAVSGTLKFAPGETVKTIKVPTKQDTADEPNETFRVTLKKPDNAKIAVGSAIVTILDDDSPDDPDDPDPPTPGEYPQSVGSGVLVNLIAAGGTKLRDKSMWAQLIADDRVLGTQASYSWDFAEISPGVINPEVGKQLKPWLDGGKRIVLEIVWKNRGGDAEAIGLPQHYENASFAYTSTSSESGVGKFQAPNYLHPDFEPAWRRFNEAFRAYIDQLTANSPGGIEFVTVGGIQPNNEMGSYDGETTPPPGHTDAKYAAALLRNLAMIEDVWGDKYKIAAQQKWDKVWSNQVFDFVAANSWIISSNGVGIKMLESGWIEKSTEERSRHPEVPVSGTEFGPSGSGNRQHRDIYEAARKAGYSYVPLSLEGDLANNLQAAGWAQDNLPNWKA